jgi:integrase
LQLFKQLEAFTFDRGIRFVSEFDLPLLEEFRAGWPDGDLARQKKQERIRTVLRYARNHKMIEHNPALELGKIVVKPKQVVPFTDDEMLAIETAARSRIEDKPTDQQTKRKMAYALILLMRYSGLRIGDATTLAIDKLQGNRLSLRTQKANKDISVLLPQPVVDALGSFKPVSREYFF